MLVFASACIGGWRSRCWPEFGHVGPSVPRGQSLPAGRAWAWYGRRGRRERAEALSRKQVGVLMRQGPGEGKTEVSERVGGGGGKCAGLVSAEPSGTRSSW